MRSDTGYRNINTEAALFPSVPHQRTITSARTRSGTHMRAPLPPHPGVVGLTGSPQARHAVLARPHRG